MIHERGASPAGLPLISIRSELSLGSHLQGLSTSVGSLIANTVYDVPLYLPRSIVVAKLWWMNGATVSGNVDCGIYRENLSRVVSAGSTARAGVSVIQEVDVADTLLTPGTYYLALVCDNGTGTFQRFGENSMWMKGTGAFTSVSTFPLPATAVVETASSGSFPVFGLATRTLVA